jgi:hypothetical protein
MVFASFLFLSMWAIGLTVNLYLGTESMLLGLLVFVPNLLISLFVAKICTAPIKKVFKALDKPADLEPDDSVLGRTCVITTSEATPTFGQARIATDGSPLLLNVVTREGKVFKKGEEVAVLEFIKNKEVYVVDKLWDSEE